MEVHPPEHPIHTWRDFFVHIATIVVGLLIAICLEQSVEWLHHRQEVHTARADLRSEATTNAVTLKDDQRRLHVVQTALLADLQTLRTLQNDPQAKVSGLTANWSWDDLIDSAYNTARDTGAFTLMPYEDVQNIDAVYTQQRYVNQASNAYVLAVSRLRAPLQGGRALAELNAQDKSNMIGSCTDALVSIDLLQDLIKSLAKDYARLEQD